MNSPTPDGSLRRAGNHVYDDKDEFKHEDSPALKDLSSFKGMTDEEKRAFDSILLPGDLYDPKTGSYWADLPLRQRIKFVNSVQSVETKREARYFWQMFRKNPIAPFTHYFRHMVLPGAGLLLEGYVLFSIGNVRPLFEAAFSSCWKTHQVCSKTWVESVDYLEILGITVGQILVGFIGDWIGRRFGLIQDAAIMFLGLVLLTASWGTSLNAWVIFYAWILFFYGIGVGGEYPMTATMGMESAVGSGKVSTADDRLYRGRKVTGAFLMQGWGQFLNQCVLMVLLVIATRRGDGSPPYSKAAAHITFRISFLLPAIGTLMLLWHRATTKSHTSHFDAAKQRGSVTGYDTKSLKLTFTYFGSRVLATAGTWFANDVFFYGNKLFQHEFIKVLTPGNKSVMVGWKYSLLNIGVSLIGYYMASMFIDYKLYGRKRMMIVGFMLDFILFVIPCFQFEYFTQKAHVRGFQAMYFLSSFFNQFGPNSVTFLVAAEVYPTPIRATAHGFSAAIGKLGALLAAVLYNYIDTQTKFYVVCWFGLAGALLTWIFLPDTTGLDLKEQERRWNFIKDGRYNDYHGIAVHPRHLSLWERMRGAGKYYNPKLDYQQRLDEIRSDWEIWHQKMVTGEADTTVDVRDLANYDLLADDPRGRLIDSYFSREASRATPSAPAMSAR